MVWDSLVYVIAALLGFANSKVYGDLAVWSVFAVILAVVSAISIFTLKKNQVQGENRIETEK